MQTQKEQLGYQELADVLNNTLTVAADVREALKDGLQVTDALVIWKNFPLLREVYEEGKEALQQLTDLTPDEAEKVIALIDKNPNLPADQLFTKIKTALRLLGRTYRLVDNLIQEGRDLAQDWVELFREDAA